MSQPVQRTGVVSIGAGDQIEEQTLYTVPAGKRLVIEEASVRAQLSSGVSQAMVFLRSNGGGRVFWIVDNGSSHRGRASVERLAARWPRSPELILVHLPIHASWLNQVEIYFSIVQCKVLKPNDFDDLATVEERLSAFERHYEQIAQPFEWTLTCRDLDRLLTKLSAQEPALKLAA
jgi:hypothetical protein